MGRGMREERKRKEGKATQPSSDERNPWGGEGVEPWGGRGGGKLGATEGEKTEPQSSRR